MRRKLMIYCEVCGSDTLTCTTDFITFHRLTFCSPDCHFDYRTAEDLRREARDQPPAAAAKAA